MENINVTLGIDNEAIIQIANLVEEQLKDSDNITETIEEVIANTDFDETITNWMDNNFGFSEYLEKEDLSDYLDYDDIADKIDIDFKVRDAMSDVIDFGDEAQSLLDSYSPKNACRLGESFTDSIQRAIEYLLETTDLSATIEQSIIERKQSDIISTKVNEMYQSRVKYLEIENKRKFEKELIDYANAVEEAKKLVEQSEFNYQEYQKEA
jgi:hypothetical protein